MKIMAWLNFAAATIGALGAITTDSEVNEFAMTMMCGVNVFFGGMALTWGSK